MTTMMKMTDDRRPTATMTPVVHSGLSGWVGFTEETKTRGHSHSHYYFHSSNRNILLDGDGVVLTETDFF